MLLYQLFLMLQLQQANVSISAVIQSASADSGPLCAHPAQLLVKLLNDSLCPYIITPLHYYGLSIPRNTSYSSIFAFKPWLSLPVNLRYAMCAALQALWQTHAQQSLLRSSLLRA